MQWKMYRIDPSLEEIIAPDTLSPKGGGTFGWSLEYAQANFGQTALDNLAATFGTFIVRLDEPPAGKTHDFDIALGTSSLGHDVEYTVNGELTWGYSFVDLPAMPSETDLETANTEFVTASAIAAQNAALEALGQFWQRYAVENSMTPYTVAQIASAGRDWYDGETIDADLEAAFEDAQAKGLLP